MTQAEHWNKRYQDVIEFIEKNHRNPSKYRLEEHDMLNWVKANRRALNAGKMKPERKELSEDESLDELMERTLNNSAVAGDVDWGRD